jgi:hypothetical protein
MGVLLTLPELASSLQSSCLHLPSSWDYRWLLLAKVKEFVEITLLSKQQNQEFH